MANSWYWIDVIVSILSPEHYFAAAVLLQHLQDLLLRGWPWKEQGHTLLLLSYSAHKTYLLSIAHEIKSTSRYKAYWFLGKWALNIHYYYLISNTSNWLYLLLICCTTTLLSIFYYLFSMYTAFVPVAMYIWCALKCQLLTILPSNIVFPAAFATAAKDFLLPLGKNCKLYYYKQVQQQHHPFIFHNYYINIRTTYMHAMVCHLNKDHPQVVYYYFSLPRLT